MLQELSSVQQISGEPFRRWFADEDFDLIVWYDDTRTVLGFQLCYDKRARERAVTWHRERGFSHDAVDAGEHDPFNNQAPVLLPDGTCVVDYVMVVFARSCGRVERSLADLIVERLWRFRELIFSPGGYSPGKGASR